MKHNGCAKRARGELHPKSIRFTSDRVGFDACRVLVREWPDEDEFGSGRGGTPFFTFGCRPFHDRGRISLRFNEASEYAVTLNRIGSLIPPDKQFDISWSGAGGKIISCEVHPRFFEKVLHLAGIEATGFRSLPPPRFVMNRRLDLLSHLLMQETEQGCPTGRPYFEHLTTAMMITVVSQTDTRLPDAGDIEAQLRRIRQAMAFVDANFSSKLTRDQIARAAGLSPFHFSRLFHQIVGLAPHQYLLRCRLQHAEKLLLVCGEDRTVADIAGESGFADQAHFARHFRRVYGVSPQQFQRTNRQKQSARTF
jgi:AraC family transcriptional regulator